MIDLKVGDSVCCVTRRTNSEEFEVSSCQISSIRIGKTATKCYTRRFGSIDAKELLFNTNWLMECDRLILVQELFLDVNGLRERAEQWCKNKGGCK